ncbi:hypothetical protein EDB83DRAFT_2320361 [Lactarius deliciosus]|nr:hypothetical protein EDB83DRAFT_2320361 [Lactarius deliciosus]
MTNRPNPARSGRRMGPASYSRTDLNNHSDVPIADPKLQLAAHAARAAKLHARLMATLDTLDSERRTYAEEISEERRQRVALQAQVRSARAERAAMEEERDSLREAVLHLIEKVELCNDYSLWPHSGLSSTSLAVPPKPRRLHEQPQTTWTAAGRAYSAALLTALREECGREHAARSAALQRVAELEAQLARREAELEERYETAPTSPIPSLSRDSAIRVLQQSAARNEALTHEVAGLVQKLEDARATLRLDESLPPDRSGTTPTPTPTIPLPLPPTPPRNRASTPESPTPRRGLAPPPPPSPPQLVRSPERLSPTPAPRHPLRGTEPPTDLARQIAVVTEDLAGLCAEQQRLSQMQHEQVHPRQQEQQDAPPRASTPPWRTFRRILLVEEECIRLRAELAASTTREAALRELLIPTPVLALESLPTERDLLDDRGDEDGVEMDLATPLQPTVLLNPEDLRPG